MNLNFSSIQSDLAYFLGVVTGGVILFLLVIFIFSVVIYKMKIS